MDKVTAHPEAAAQAAPEVSVVIPCLNEEQSIALCIDKALAALQGAGIRGEVVVADNGSTDGSIAIASLILVAYVRFLVDLGSACASIYELIRSY